MVFLAKLLFPVLAAVSVLAHPGHNVEEEAAQRLASLQQLNTRSLGSCNSALKARGVKKVMAERREAIFGKISKRKLVSRDYSTALNTSHHSNLTGIGPFTDPTELFEGQNSCVLAPEATQGPYYVTGEMIRSHVAEQQDGVPLWLDVQFVDVNNCQPIPGVAVDLWHANATGSYSGVEAQAGVKTTWLRGIQVTDADGVVNYQSIIPGHYTGRAQHIHLIAHSPGNWTLLRNGTITGGNDTPHIGQIFLDQDLLDEVENTYPYTTNTQAWTKNNEDSILKQESQGEGVDPMVEYVLLGDKIEDGVFGWISIGIDPSAVYKVTEAAHFFGDGAASNDCMDMLNLDPKDATSVLPARGTACPSI